MQTDTGKDRQKQTDRHTQTDADSQIQRQIDTGKDRQKQTIVIKSASRSVTRREKMMDADYKDVANVSDIEEYENDRKGYWCEHKG